MDTKLLNKYIAGDVLPEEKKEVVRWLKESEEHREQLMQLRHIYDATVWNANLKEEKPGKKKTVTHYLRTSIKIAAVVAMLAFILHKEYQEYAHFVGKISLLYVFICFMAFIALSLTFYSMLYLSTAEEIDDHLHEPAP